MTRLAKDIAEAIKHMIAFRGVPYDSPAPGGLYYRQPMEEVAAIIDAKLAEQWISVDERLPTCGVLVARDVPYDPRFGDRDVTIGYVSKTGWRDDHGSIENDGAVVTHWMPLPPAPTQKASKA